MKTRFRAYQLDSPGSLFSYADPTEFTLIEARLPKEGLKVLQSELQANGKTKLDTLHITSWEEDHCEWDALTQILNHLRPSRIEIPAYTPSSDNGKLCKRIIENYEDIHEKYVPNVVVVSTEYVKSLPGAAAFGTNNVLYPPEYSSDKANDWSLIKLLRSRGFHVASLGDCESKSIADRLCSSSIFTTEVDVLILPHHGADNGFMTGEFLDKVKPKLAVCSSNYDNQYEHPRPRISQLLSERGIPLMTTKRGDVIVFHRDQDVESTAVNFISNNTDRETPVTFTPKRVYLEVLHP